MPCSTTLDRGHTKTLKCDCTQLVYALQETCHQFEIEPYPHLPFRYKHSLIILLVVVGPFVYLFVWYWVPLFVSGCVWMHFLI